MHHAKTTLLVGSIVCLICLVAAPAEAQPDDPLQEMRRQIAQLQLDMARLRNDVDALKAGGASEVIAERGPAQRAVELPDARNLDRTMTVESVEEIERDVADELRIAARKEHEAEECRSTVAANDERVRRLKLQVPPPTLNTQERDTWFLNRDREVRKLNSESKKLRTRAENLEQQAQRIRKDAAEPRHVIRGWQGDTRIELETFKDLSMSLPKPGDFVEWSGRPTADSGDGVKRWSVTMVRPVRNPDRP